MGEMQSDLSAAIASIYEAGADAEKWSAALDMVSNATESSSYIFTEIENDGRYQRIRRAFSGGRINRDEADYYCSNIFGDDDLVDLVRVAAPDSVITSDVVGPDGIRRSRMYRDWYGRLDIMHFTFAVLRDEARTFVLSFNRSGREGSHRKKQRARISALLPHFSRAVRLDAALRCEREKLDLSLRAIDALGGAAMLIDGDGRISALSRRAERLSAKADFPAAATSMMIGETARRQLLSAEFPHDMHALLLRSATDTERIGRDPTPSLLLMAGPAMIRDEIVEDLRDMFGLSFAESRVATAALVMAGISNIARHLNLGVETVRTHLRKAYAKTDVRSHAEFVQKIRDCRLLIARRGDRPQ